MAVGKKTGGKDFKPGVSGNPDGRPPKGEALADILIDRADKEALADKILELAMSGSETMLKYAYDRIYGKAIETRHNINQNLPEVVEINLGETRDRTAGCDKATMEE